MSCQSWNIQGLDNPKAFNALSSLVLSVKPSLLFLMESQLCGSEISSSSRKFFYYSFHCVDTIGRAGGLILRWRKSLEVFIISKSMYHISFHVCYRAAIEERFGTGFYGWPS